MLFVLAIVGLVSSMAAFLIGFVPSSQFGGGSTLVYVAIIGGGLLVIGLLIPFLFLKLRKPGWKNAVPAADGDEG
jgi:glutamate:GABA antiporter